MSAARDNGKGVLPGPQRAAAAMVIAVTVPAAFVVGPAAASPVGPAVHRPSVVICSGYARCRSRGHSDHGYPAHARASYWRMTAGNECTNYVAYVEHRTFRARTPRYLLGNAGQWAATARRHGVRVNHTPSRGAVAEWNGGAMGMGPAGHVAVVERVGPHRRYIIISQQHIGSDRNGYDWTRINSGFRRSWEPWPSNFLHFPRHRHRHRHRR